MPSVAAPSQPAPAPAPMPTAPAPLVVPVASPPAPPPAPRAPAVLRAEREGQVWSYAIIEAEAYGGRRFKVMVVIDEFTHECLMIRVLRDAAAETAVLAELFAQHGRPEHLHADDTMPEFAAKAVRDWLALSGAKPDLLGQGTPVAGSFLSSFVARLRGELIASQAFGSPAEAQYAFEAWMKRYNAAALRGVPGRSASAQPSFKPAAPAPSAPAQPSFRPAAPAPAAPAPALPGGGYSDGSSGSGGTPSYAARRPAPYYAPYRWRRYPY